MYQTFGLFTPSFAMAESDTWSNSQDRSSESCRSASSGASHRSETGTVIGPRSAPPAQIQRHPYRSPTKQTAHRGQTVGRRADPLPKSAPCGSESLLGHAPSSSRRGDPAVSLGAAAYVDKLAQRTTRSARHVTPYIRVCGDAELRMRGPNDCTALRGRSPRLDGFRGRREATAAAKRPPGAGTET